MIKIAGRIAKPRVISRRIQGDSFQCMKPSITTWPASVPVIVLLCPLANSATANRMLAAAVPISGASVKIGHANPVARPREGDHLSAGHVHAFFAVEHHRGQHQDRRIHEKRDDAVPPRGRSC